MWKKSGKKRKYGLEQHESAPALCGIFGG